MYESEEGRLSVTRPPSLHTLWKTTNLHAFTLRNWHGEIHPPRTSFSATGEIRWIAILSSAVPGRWSAQRSEIPSGSAPLKNRTKLPSPGLKSPPTKHLGKGGDLWCRRKGRKGGRPEIRAARTGRLDGRGFGRCRFRGDHHQDFGYWRFGASRLVQRAIRRRMPAPSPTGTRA